MRSRSNACTSAPSGPAGWPSPPTGCARATTTSLDLSFTARIGTLLVGSVRMSTIRVGDTPALLLGPLTVEPPFRQHGIGKALIERALAEAKTRGHRLAVLVGDEPYYGKLGFKRIPKGRAKMPGPVDPARLLVCELVKGRVQRRLGSDPPGLGVHDQQGCPEFRAFTIYLFSMLQCQIFLTRTRPRSSVAPKSPQTR